MGCDIHIYTERLYNGKWINCDYWQVNPYYDGTDDEPAVICKHVYDGRNYDLFGVLAGVRNICADRIDDPRGIPSDIHAMTKQAYIRAESYAHNASWLRMDELLDWENKKLSTTNNGYLNADGVSQITLYGMPDNENCSDEKHGEYIYYKEWVPTHTEITYFIHTLKDRMAEEFLYCTELLSKETIREKLSKHYKDFRIVFWFDS